MSDPKKVLRKYSEMLVQRAGVVELRVLRVGSKSANYAGFFDSGKALADWAEKYSGEAGGVYTTLNQIHPACFLGDQAVFRVTNQTGRGVKSCWDVNITRRLWIPMDFDPVSKVRPSSHEELERAGETATRVYEWLTKQGWPEPVKGMSGNGVHLLYGADFPETKEATDALRRMFIRLAHYTHYSVATHTKFDTVNFNPARIWKMYGTLAKKGTPKQDRPHRTANCTIPDKIGLVTLEMVQALAGSPENESQWYIVLPGQDPPHDNKRDGHKALGKGDYSTLDVAAWFSAHQKYRFSMGDGKHSVYCPWADNHSSQQDARGCDSVVWEADTSTDKSWPVFHCSHDSCSNPDKSFGDVRELWGDADKYCTGAFDWKKHKRENSGDSPEDMETHSLSDMEILQGLCESRSDLGVPRKRAISNSPPENLSPGVGDVAPKAKRSKMKFDDATKEVDESSSEVDAVIEDLGKVLEAHSDLSEESTRPFADRPGGDDESPPGQGDSEDGGKPSVFNFKQKNNTRDYVLKNLVLVKGTRMVYHIGWDRFMNPAEVRLTFPGLGTEWINMRSNRLEVMPDDLVFDPGAPLHDPSRPHVLNRFQGMPALEGPSLEPHHVEEHLQFICDNDATLYTYFLSWLACQVQRPGVKMSTAMVVQGPPGSGKSVFFDRFGEMGFGRYYTQAGGTELESRFNGILSCKLFVVFNEVHTSRHNKTVKNKLKSLITDPRIIIEMKGKDCLVENNRMNMVFLSNEETPLTIEFGDRRYVVVEMFSIKPKAYYHKLVEQMELGEMRGFIEKLRTMDLGGFHPHAVAPMTKAKSDAIEARMNPADRFLRQLKDGMVDMPVSPLVHSGVVRTTDLWDAFRIFRAFNNYTYTGHMGSFFSKAERIFGVPRVSVNVPKGACGSTKRFKWSGYLLDGSQGRRSPTEIYQSSLVFSGSVTSNNVADPSHRVDGLNT